VLNSNCVIFFGCTLAAILLLAAGPAAGERAPAKTTTAAERYVWDLGDLYPNVAEWEAERRRLLAELPKLEALTGTFIKSTPG